jgi:hypothetical protein
MKILNKARIHRLKQTEHIHNEKNVLRQLNHPFIVRLYVNPHFPPPLSTICAHFSQVQFVQR